VDIDARFGALVPPNHHVPPPSSTSKNGYNNYLIKKGEGINSQIAKEDALRSRLKISKLRNLCCKISRNLRKMGAELGIFFG
jgi:hypothetical protein